MRVAFLDQVGGVPGGAERTLGTFLKHRPPDVDAVPMLFDDGSFADELRGLDLDVRVLDVPDALRESTRERLGAAGALAVPAAAVTVARAVRESRADLLYTNTMKSHVVGSLASRLARVPCIVHLHDIVEGSALNVLRAAARVGSRERIACSKVVADAIGLPKTTPIYGPVEVDAYASLPDRATARRQLGIPPDETLPAIAIVGRINRWKGHDRFLRIAARVVATTPARFLIVGAPIFRDADFVPELHALVRDLGLAEYVTFVPWVDDVRAVYAAIDLNVNCSTREPLGRTLAEALAAGVPTVLFDDSGAAETLHGDVDGRAVPAGDEGAFARAILDFIGPGAPPRDAAAIRRAARAFDAPVIAEQMATVIRRCVRE